MSTVTSPIMTDDTGQDIADALSALINAIKPDASDIKYDSSTTVKGKIDEINNNKLNKSAIKKLSFNDTTNAYGAIRVDVPATKPIIAIQINDANAGYYAINTVLNGTATSQYVTVKRNSTNENVVNTTVAGRLWYLDI